MGRIDEMVYNGHYWSEVEGFEGLCAPTWINGNSLDRRTSGMVTGFFKLVKRHWFWGWCKHGKEFHGYIDGRVVKTTEGIWK